MSYTLSGLRRFALAAALFGFAASAQAVIEIQWWHSMTRQARRQGQRARHRSSTRARTTTRSCPSSRAVRRVDGGGDRRLPRRQRAAHPAGVRGRHGDDDGGQGRDQAGLPGDGGGGREVRSEGVPAAPWPATTPTRRASCCRSRSTARRRCSTSTRTRSRRPASIPTKPPKTWPEVGAGGGEAQGVGGALRLHDRLAVVGAARELQRLAQRADRHQGERLRRPRHAARVQRAAAGPAHPDARRLGEEGPLHLRRPQERAGRQVHERRMRDDHDVERRVREHQGQRQVRLARRTAAVLRRRQGRAAEHDHRRRDAVGDGRQKDRRATRASPSSSPSCRRRRSRRTGTRRPATCRSRWRPTS